jgi:hypothetical protein
VPAIGAALVGLVVFAIRLPDAGGGFGSPPIVYLTPLSADLPMGAFHFGPRRLSYLSSSRTGYGSHRTNAHWIAFVLGIGD